MPTSDCSTRLRKSTSLICSASGPFPSRDLLGVMVGSFPKTLRQQATARYSNSDDKNRALERKGRRALSAHGRGEREPGMGEAASRRIAARGNGRRRDSFPIEAESQLAQPVQQRGARLAGGERRCDGAVWTFPVGSARSLTPIVDCEEAKNP